MVITTVRTSRSFRSRDAAAIVLLTRVRAGRRSGTELFGVGADRFIWLAYKENKSKRTRLLSLTYPCPISTNGVVSFASGEDVPEPGSDALKKYEHSWARFPFGVDWVLRKHGYDVSKGMDVVIFSDIPGGGMSRSASLTLNLVLTTLEVNGHAIPSGDDRYAIVELAQKVENDYIGSPCGNLDQVMILYARDGFGTHFIPSKGRKGEPRGGTVRYVPLGGGMSANDFRIVALDTGTDRPGLEKSTYAVRSKECVCLAKMLSEDQKLTELRQGRTVTCLADVESDEQLGYVLETYGEEHPNLCARLCYIYEANRRFETMMRGWAKGDLKTVGAVFREDGHGLRDQYKISGPELETMCDIARSVPGCLGERMLGGGDKGASGAIVAAGSEDDLVRAVQTAYPRAYPDLKDKFRVHVCKFAQGIKSLDGLLGKRRRIE